jgi:hypothetical protein
MVLPRKHCRVNVTGWCCIDRLSWQADRDGLRDLTAPVFKDTRVLRPAYAALGSHVLQQLLLQRSTGLNEQASVNGFLGDTHALIIGILGFQPAGNLLRRPVQNQFTRNDVLQLQVDGKKAALGSMQHHLV